MHRYYNSGSTKSIAYFNAILALIIAFMFTGFHFIWFLDLANYIPGGGPDTPRYLRYLVGAIVTVPIVYVISRLFKKEDVLKIEMDKSSRRIGYVFIIFYFIFTFILLMYQAFNKITIYDFI